MEEIINTVALQPWDDEKSKRFSNHALVGRILSSEKDLMPKDIVKSIINQSWGFTEPVELLALQPNIFVLFFKNKADRTRAWNLRPWSIQDYHFLLQPWKPDCVVEEFDLDYTSFWVHIHGLPFNFISLRNIEAIGNFLGEFEDVDHGKFGLSGCLRLRVKWNIRKPFIPGFPLKRDNLPDGWISLQYEKLNDFCSKYGLLGHEIEMCESVSSVVNQEESEVNLLKLGPWIKASSAICPGFETLDSPSEEKQSVAYEEIPTLNATLEPPGEEKPVSDGGGIPALNASLGAPIEEKQSATPSEEKEQVAQEGTPFILNATVESPIEEKQPSSDGGTPTSNVAPGATIEEKQPASLEGAPMLNVEPGAPSEEKQQVAQEGSPTLNATLGKPTEENQQTERAVTSSLNAAPGGPAVEKQEAASEGTSSSNMAPGAPLVEKQPAGCEGTKTKCYGSPSERKVFGFTTVDCLKPATDGHRLVVKVLNSNIVFQQGSTVSRRLRNACIAECLVGDETGTIIFTARNDQVDVMKPGRTIGMLNAKINMFKGSMRLAVGPSGCVQILTPGDFEVDEHNNLSLVEYELCTIVEE